MRPWLSTSLEENIAGMAVRKASEPGMWEIEIINRKYDNRECVWWTGKLCAEAGS